MSSSSSLAARSHDAREGLTTRQSEGEFGGEVSEPPLPARKAHPSPRACACRNRRGQRCALQFTRVWCHVTCWRGWGPRGAQGRAPWGRRAAGASGVGPFWATPLQLSGGQPWAPTQPTRSRPPRAASKPQNSTSSAKSTRRRRHTAPRTVVVAREGSYGSYPRGPCWRRAPAKMGGWTAGARAACTQAPTRAPHPRTPHKIPASLVCARMA